MSQFPALQPSSRSFVPGATPVSTYVSLAGKETRVITGADPVAHSLSLSFANVSESVARQIMTHWYGRQGTALSFLLPNAVWAGWADYVAGVGANQKWRYTAAPSVAAVSPGIMSLSLELIAVL